jgi:integrase
MPLTETNLEKLGKPGYPSVPETGQVLIWDTKQKGFGLRLTKGAKVYIAQSTVNGKDRRIKIGPVENISAEGARKEAIKLLGQMNAGVDPNAVKAAAKKKERTLADVLDDYLTRKQLRPGTEELYKLSFRLGLSDWSKRTLDEITRDEVEKRYDKLCNGWRAVEPAIHKNGRREGAPIRQTSAKGKSLASQALRLLGQMYNFEIEVNDRDDIRNPVKRLSHVRKGWTQSEQRTSVVMDNELSSFYQAIQKCQHEDIKDYFMLVLLTGLRAQEAAGLEWTEVHLDDGYLLIDGSRTKNSLDHALPLTPFLKELLVRRQEKTAGKLFVFPSNGKSGHLVEPKTAFNNVSKRLGKHITPHTLRHTFATVSQRLGVNPRLQSKLLNHAKKEITDRYIHADIPMLAEPMLAINKHFLDLMEVPQPKPVRTTKRKNGAK